MREQLVVLQPPAGLEAVDARHDRIHQNQVGSDLVDQVQRAGPIGGNQNREPGAVERVGQKPERFGSVVDHQ